MKGAQKKCSQGRIALENLNKGLNMGMRNPIGTGKTILRKGKKITLMAVERRTDVSVAIHAPL